MANLGLIGDAGRLGEHDHVDQGIDAIRSIECPATLEEPKILLIVMNTDSNVLELIGLELAWRPLKMLLGRHDTVAFLGELEPLIRCGSSSILSILHKILDIGLIDIIAAKQPGPILDLERACLRNPLGDSLHRHDLGSLSIANIEFLHNAVGVVKESISSKNLEKLILALDLAVVNPNPHVTGDSGNTALGSGGHVNLNAELFPGTDLRTAAPRSSASSKSTRSKNTPTRLIH